MNAKKNPSALGLARAFELLKPGRKVHGISAVLLPWSSEGSIDWKGFEEHIERTSRAGLDVALNMDTGFGNLLGESERVEVIDAARRVLGPDKTFYSGAYSDANGGGDPVGGYHAAIEHIESRGGVPVIVQCMEMQGLGPADKRDFYARILEPCRCAIGFELSTVFAPHGEIWDDETFNRLIELPKLIGAKHSSLDRAIEFGRLEDRDRLRPDFRIYTGNDLAIDMVAYGSDYLLGLSTFAPEKFAERDEYLIEGDARFLSLNDALQHLGNVGFRAPVPAYKHSAAQYLHLVGKLAGDGIHPDAPKRPESDRILLLDCARRLGEEQDAK